MSEPTRDPGALEAHYTPLALARAIVATLRVRPGDVVLEPHLGGGAIAEALCDVGATVLACDLDPHAPGKARLLGRPGFRYLGDGNFLDPLSEPRRRLHLEARQPTLVIGNPPFSSAIDHVRAALEVAPQVAYLLPMPFLAADERRPLHEEHPILEWWPVCPRPSFDRGGTARSECIVAHWLRGWGGPTVNRQYLHWQRPPLKSTRHKPGEAP